MPSKTFDCGCTLSDDKIDYNNIRLDCPAVWDLIRAGLTKGCFQIESQLCKAWCKRIKPSNIEELSDLIALVRPGCLQAIVDDKNMVQHYADRKAGIEPPEYLTPELQKILESTYGVLVYQEQAINIAKELAGFDLKEADTLRKAIGKKKADIMSEMQELFYKKALGHGLLTQEQIEIIFGQIKASQRYSFNKCISEDVLIHRPNCRQPLTVGELYKIAKDRQYAIKVDQEKRYQRFIDEGHYGYGLSLYTDGSIRQNLIIDIKLGQIQKVYRITLKNGYTIEVNGSHRFPTPLSVKVASDLTPSDYLICVDTTKFFGQPRKDGVMPTVSKVVSVQYIGEKQTYDLCMDKPFNSFIAGDGILSFNSHSICYAINAYMSAYAKAHFPLKFFEQCLKYADHKLDPKTEIDELIAEAKLFNIKILPPKITTKQENFHIDGDAIRFGLSNIKHVGKVKCKSLLKYIGTETFENLTFTKFLLKFGNIVSSPVIESLIKVGALDFIKNLSRNQMLFYYNKWQLLTDKEKELIEKHDLDVSNLSAVLLTCKLKDGGPSNRYDKVNAIIEAIKNPPYDLSDDPSWISEQERFLLGTPISYTEQDVYDVASTNCSCREFLEGKLVDEYVVFGKIRRLSYYKCKKGKMVGETMAFLTIDDGTAVLDNIAIFPSMLEKCKPHLFVNNPIILIGKRDAQRDTLKVSKINGL